MVNIDAEFAEDRDVDETALDVEWLDHSRIAYKWGKIYVDLKYDLQKAEERKKIVRSEIILHVNRKPEGTVGKAKPNKEDIEAYYRTNKQYIDAVNEVLELTREVEYAEIAKNEILFTRKKSLEHLVTLHGDQYFAGPRVPRNLTEERKKKEKAVNIRIKQKTKTKEV